MSKLTKEEQIYERFVYRITRKEKEDIHRQEREYPVICGRFLKNGLRLDDMAIGKS